MTVQRDIRYKFKDGSRIYLPELFAELNKLLAPDSTDEQKLDARHLAEAYVRKDKDHEKLMRQFIEALYHPAVVLNLPKEVPPYDNSAWQDFTMAPGNLQNALGHLHYFVEGSPSYIRSKIKREHFYIQTVESLYRHDAKLYDAILLKKFPTDVYKNLGVEFFYSVYPGYFKGINVDEIAAAEKPEPVKPKKPAAKKTSTTKKSTTKKSTTKKSTTSKKDSE